MPPQPILVARSWGKKKGEYDSYANVEELYTLYSAMSLSSPSIHSLEILPEGTPRKCYFDIDASDLPENTFPFQSYFDAIRDTLHHNFGVTLCPDDVTMCASNLDQNGNFVKYSYHVTLPYIVSPKLNQDLAKEINTRTGTSYADLNVYHSHQAIRLAFCTKPLKGVRNVDPHQRRKMLSENTLGTFKKALISYTDGLPVLSRGQSPGGEFTYPGRLAWFVAVLADPGLREIWSAKAKNYDSWLQVGFALYYEGRKADEHATAEHLYQQFTDMSPDKKGFAEDVPKKYHEDCSKVTYCHWKAIKGWLTARESTRDICAQYDELFKPSKQTLPVAPVVSAPDANEDGGEELPVATTGFVPYTAAQYRFTAHMKLPRVVNWWRQQITRVRDVAKLLPIIRYESKDEQERRELYQAKCALLKEYGNPTPPFPEEDNEETALVWLLLTHLDIQFTDDDLSAVLLEAYDPKTYRDSFKVYMDHLCDIAPRQSKEIEDRIRAKTIIPVGRNESVDAWSRFLLFAEELDDGMLWKTQIPYWKLIKGVARDIQDAQERLMLVGEEVPSYNPNVLFSAFTGLFTAERVFHYFCSACSDTDAARIVYAFYPLWKLNEQMILYVYDETTGLWCKEEEAMFRIITNYTNFLELTKVTAKEGNYGNMSGSKTRVLKELTHLDTIRAQKCSFEELLDSSDEKLLFPNGYYDGKKDVFVPALHLNRRSLFASPEIMFVCQVPDPFDHTLHLGSVEEKLEMEQVLFLAQHGEEVGNYHREQLALALMGKISKKAHAHVGPPNSGKSTEIALIKAAFGSYVGEFHIDEFKHENGRGRETALENGVAFDNWMKRIIFSSESSPNEISNDKFKLHSSGRKDRVITRTVFKGKITVTPRYIMFLYVNNLWKWLNPNDPAIAERMNFYEWDKLFVDTVSDPTCQLQKRTDVDVWPTSQRRRQLFVGIMLDTWLAYRARGYKPLAQPVKVTQASLNNFEQMETTVEVFERLMYELEFDGDPQNYITVEDFKLLCENKGFQPDSARKKITEVVNRLNVSSNKTIKPTKKHIKGKGTKNVITGISIRPTLMNDPCASYYLTDYQQWKRLMETYDMLIPSEILRELRSVAALITLNRGYTEAEVDLIERHATEEQKEWVCKHNRLANLDFSASQRRRLS